MSIQKRKERIESGFHRPQQNSRHEIVSVSKKNWSELATEATKRLAAKTDHSLLLNNVRILVDLPMRMDLSKAITARNHLKKISLTETWLILNIPK